MFVELIHNSRSQQMEESHPCQEVIIFRYFCNSNFEKNLFNFR